MISSCKKVRKIAFDSHSLLSKAHHMAVLNLKGSGNLNSVLKYNTRKIGEHATDCFSSPCLNNVKTSYILPMIDAQLLRHHLS